MLTFDNNAFAAEQLLLWNLVRLRHSFPSSGRNHKAGYGRLLTDMRVCNVVTSVEELKKRRATLMNKYRRLKGKGSMTTETTALAVAFHDGADATALHGTDYDPNKCLPLNDRASDLNKFVKGKPVLPHIQYDFKL